MAASKQTVDRFRAAITRAFTRPTERIDDQLDFDHKYQHLFKAEYDTAIGLIVSVKTSDTLAALMTVYLDLYARHSANANNIHYVRSDQTFAELIERSAKVPAETRDLFLDWARVLDGSSQSPEFAGFKKRFDELSVTAKGKVSTFIARERKRRRDAESILDVLRSEYLAQFGWQATSYESLEDFNPYPGDAFRSQFDEQLTLVAAAWEIAAADDDPKNVEAFTKAFDKFGEYLATVSRSGALPVFQVVAFLRDRMARKTEKVPWGTIVWATSFPPFVPELYAAACMRLLIVANRQLARRNNRLGFTDEELVFFLRPIAGRTGGYDSDLAKRIAAKPDAATGVFEWSKLFLSLLLLTKSHLIHVVNLKKTLEIQSRWAEIAKVTERLAGADDTQLAHAAQDSRTQAAIQSLVEMADTTVELSGGLGLAQAEIRIGTWLGDRPNLGSAKVVFIDPGTYDLYIEFEPFKPFLFMIKPDTARGWLFDARKASIHRATIGSVYVAQAIVMAVGFLPALVEGGIGGLVYEIGVYIGGVGVEEVVSEINPKAGKILGFLTQIVVPRPHFGPKVVAPTEPVVKVMSVGPPEGVRSFDEILASKQEEARLTTEFNKSTAKGMAAHIVEVARDKVVELQAGLEEFAADATVLAPAGELATDAGLTFRVSDSPAGGAAGTGGGGGGAAAAGGGRGAREAVRLRKTKEFAQLEDYLYLLEDGNKLQVRRARAQLMMKLERGMVRYGEARKEIVNFLNTAKETTGEYVADGLVYSSYKVRRIIDIPRRNAKVPILDRVYEVEAHGAPGDVFYVFAEIKGGRGTKLGSVSEKEYEFSAEGLAVETHATQVRQASPEWYYQKIIEMYETGATALERQRNQAVARELFDAAKAGKVESLVIKSGRSLDPFVKVDSGFTAWFKGKVLPYDRPVRP
jgi:hypothetical protein